MLTPALVLFAAASQGAAAAGVPLGNEITPVNDLPSTHSYRSGIVVGTSLGAALSGSSGYPNNAQDIGDSADYSASGLMAGSYGSFYVMGAFSDYVSVGFWFGHVSAQNSEFRASGTGAGLRLEGFPLVDLVPALHGLGVLGQFGFGSGELNPKPAGLVGSSGTQSFVGAGGFYEWSFGHLLGGHIGVGPSLEYDAIFSRPFEWHGMVASLRLVFYGGP